MQKEIVTNQLNCKVPLGWLLGCCLGVLRVALLVSAKSTLKHLRFTALPPSLPSSQERQQPSHFRDCFVFVSLKDS